jgi:hypothetical protein
MPAVIDSTTRDYALATIARFAREPIPLPIEAFGPDATLTSSADHRGYPQPLISTPNGAIRLSADQPIGARLIRNDELDRLHASLSALSNSVRDGAGGIQDQAALIFLTTVLEGRTPEPFDPSSVPSVPTVVAKLQKHLNYLDGVTMQFQHDHRNTVRAGKLKLDQGKVLLVLVEPNDRQQFGNGYTFTTLPGESSLYASLPKTTSFELADSAYNGQVGYLDARAGDSQNRLLAPRSSAILLCRIDNLRTAESWHHFLTTDRNSHIAPRTNTNRDASEFTR